TDCTCFQWLPRRFGLRNLMLVVNNYTLVSKSLHSMELVRYGSIPSTVKSMRTFSEMFDPSQRATIQFF
ncbi:MAG: hypothetical protein ACO3NJ_09250, partial [Candidatus Poseidoniaceae archaeon]